MSGRDFAGGPVPSEASILAACRAVLRARGVFAWRQNTGAMTIRGGGKRRFVRFGFAGAPDVIGVLPGGRFLGLEAKRPGKFPTPVQLAFLQAVNHRGGVGVWVSDAAQLDAVLGHVLAGGRVRVDDGANVYLEEASDDPA